MVSSDQEFPAAYLGSDFCCCQKSLEWKYIGHLTLRGLCSKSLPPVFTPLERKLQEDRIVLYRVSSPVPRTEPTI